ncbi:glycerol-3-phosphate 1-O-acyltransferase PlsY [Candidatus Eisenbacteria bacterium]|uniref:Glycerol-3-phosphate acyltransferase n=1 Tax=Eiseniibacteriota bacterium TaxID=2212470 RepID=A0ABV6YN91_UNCEI
MLHIVVLALLAYLVGSIPIGFMIGKARGVDLRTIGSGNVGATNVYRAFGFRLAIFVFMLDVSKGFVGAAVLPAIWTPDALSITWVRIICGVAAIAGSIASIFMKFKGGKGVATAVGVFLALEPLSTVIGLVIWTLLFVRYRYVSLGSIVGATSLPILIAVFNQKGLLRYPVFYLSVLVAIIVALRHRSNIGRLLKGTENRIGATRGGG